MYSRYRRRERGGLGGGGTPIRESEGRKKSGGKSDGTWEGRKQMKGDKEKQRRREGRRRETE